MTTVAAKAPLSLRHALILGLLVGLPWAILVIILLRVLLPEWRPAGRIERVVEPPPMEYTTGPTLTGRTRELDLPDPRQVNTVCTQALGPTWPRGGYWMGCYIGAQDLVVVPARGAWPSEAERQALIAHEWAHARGWVHQADGHYGRPKAPVQVAQRTLPASPTAPAEAPR